MSEKKIYAGFWIRLLAGFLDILFLAPFLAILFSSLGITEFQNVTLENFIQKYNDSAAETNSSDLIIYGLSILYATFFIHSSQQATLGKRLVRIYVGNPDGSKLSLAKSIARALMSIVTSATLGLGFLLVIFTKEKTALHDLVCNTRVFHGKK